MPKGKPIRRPQPVTNAQLRAMTPEGIARGMEDGTLRLPTVPDVNSELPPDVHFIDHRVFHGLSFRQNAALHGGMLKPEDWWAPEDVVAWFMDEGSE